MAARMAAVLPARWFPPLAEAPVLRGLLTGIGQAWAWCYAVLDRMRDEARIATASGVFLDMAALDFFGTGLRRRASEGDGEFRLRLQRNLLRERATRGGVLAAVALEAGGRATVFEPSRPGDTGGYGGPGNWHVGGGFGYGAAGLAYGSLSMPFQIFVDVERAADVGAFAGVAGYGGSALADGVPSGYGCGPAAYGPGGLAALAATEADVASAIANAIPAGTLAWMRVR